MNADGGLQVGHVVFETGLDHRVVLVALVAETLPGVLAHAVQRQDADPVGQFGIVGQDHAAFAGGQVLGHVEAVTTAQTGSTHRAPVVSGFQGVRAVLDQHQVVLADDRHDGVHVAGAPGEMHDQHRPGALADRRLDRRGIDVHAGRIDVGQDRRGAAVDDRVHRGAEGQRRGDDLVARPEAGGDQAQVQGGRAGVDRDRVPGAAVGGDRVLESPHPGARTEPAAAHGGHDLLDLGVLDGRCAEDQESFGGPDRLMTGGHSR